MKSFTNKGVRLFIYLLNIHCGIIMNTDKSSARIYLHLSLENLAISKGIFDQVFQLQCLDLRKMAIHK